MSASKKPFSTFSAIVRRRTATLLGASLLLGCFATCFTGCTKDVSGSGRVQTSADSQTVGTVTTAPASVSVPASSIPTTTVIVGRTDLPNAFRSGNTNGNLANGGIAADGNGTRFYINNDTIYKQPTTSRSAKVLVYLDAVCQLNYCDDMLYCSAKDGIYCVHVGTGLAKRVVDLEAQVGSWVMLQVTADGVFYSDGKTIWQNTIAFDNEQVRYAATDGVIDQLLWMDGTLCFTQYLQTAGGETADAESGVYAISLAQTGAEAVKQIHAGRCHSLVFTQQQLYYCDPAARAVMRMNLDGTNPTTAFAGDYTGLMPMENGFLASRADAQLVRLSADGGGETTLASGYCPNVVDKTLYYWSEQGNMLAELPLS